MSFEPLPATRRSLPARRIPHRAAFALLGPILLASLACGHKSEPFPPPLRNPAAAKDLTVQQRGSEIILSFSYPQSTVSGTALEPLEKVEIWELVRQVPDWTPPTPDDESEAVDESESTTEIDRQADPEEEPDIFDEVPGAGDDPSRPLAPPAEAGADSVTGADDTAPESEDEETEDEEAEDETEAAEPIPVRPSDEKLLTVDAGEFVATATLRTTLEGPSLSAAVFGDQIVLTLPIERPQAPPASPEEEEPEEREVGDRESEADADQSNDYGSIFAIKTAVGERFVSSFSNLAVIAHREPPAAPDTFSLEPDQTRIAVRWQAGDEEIAGFHVYRRDAQSPSYGAPLSFVPFIDPAAQAMAEAAEEESEAEAEAAEVDEREYSDRTAELGKRYIYALTTVSNRVPVTESSITLEREADYTDRFPPSAPKNPLALAEEDRVRLLWDESPQDDVAGYYVMRRDGGETFERLTDGALTGLEFTDLDVRRGSDYSYRVIAVDHAGNESGPSKTVDVRTP